MYATRIYRKSPIWLQEGLIAARAWARASLREGRAFRSLLKEFEKTQWYSSDELSAFQLSMLQRVLAHCSSDVPYYRERFAEIGFDSSAVAKLDDVKVLPLLDKSDVRRAGRSLRSARMRGPIFKGGTSGTTGSPLIIFQDLNAINRENAFVWRQLQWAGYSLGDRRVWLRGDMIVPIYQTSPPYWRMNRFENLLMCSSYHLSERNAPFYLDAIARFDPVIIQAYPSSIGYLANYLEATDGYYSGKSLKGIVTSSESVPEDMRSTIEKRFGCLVFDWYGQYERVAAIGTCEHGRYHVISDYSFVEFVPTSDGLYEIVGTSFNNDAMPLIRYRTGDFVEPALVGDASCPCGRSFPIVQFVHGRYDDVVKLPDGRRVGRLDHIFKGVNGIIEAQIRQEASDAVVILVVRAASYDMSTEEQLLSNARSRLGPDMRIDIQSAQSIPRTANGKFRGVVCNV